MCATHGVKYKIQDQLHFTFKHNNKLAMYEVDYRRKTEKYYILYTKIYNKQYWFQM